MTRYQKIPWLRIGTESVAIVASILLAFAIDAWWVGQQEREEVQVLLTALKEEAQSNLLEIDKELTYRHAAIESATKLLSASAENVRLEPVELNQLLGGLMWWGNAVFADGALDGLIQGGVLSLIESRSLRSMVASLPEEFAEVRRNEVQDFALYRDVLMPFLYKNTLLPEISNAQLVRPGTEDWEVPRLPIGERNDYSDLINNSEFIGIVAHRIYNQSDAINAYADLREVLEKLTLEIDETLRE